MKRDAQPARALDAQALKAWPLPAIADDADKEDRGRILVVAGSREIPGAALLAATAALRAGAGKLVIATAASMATGMALLMPEARVVGLPETAKGGLDAAGVSQLQEIAAGCAAAVIGPGMMDERGSGDFVAALLPWLGHCTVVLDALAMNVTPRLAPFDQPVLLTPHAGEMAHLSGRSKDDVTADPQAAAMEAARRWRAVIALKGASGDTLAGIIGGLAARGASMEQACAWGVVLHAAAGARLASTGPLGFLARELPAEVPAALHQLCR